MHLICKKDKTLGALQRSLYHHYADYKSEKITQEEYLKKIKPIDKNIVIIELNIFHIFFELSVSKIEK